MHLSGLDEEAPEQENAQDNDNRDDDNLDEAHSEILKVGGQERNDGKGLKQAHSTSLKKPLSTNLLCLPLHLPRIPGFSRGYESYTKSALEWFWLFLRST